MASTAEALRTKIDNLQWEVNHLDVKNRRLRADNVDTNPKCDLESDLEQTKQNVVSVTGELEACQRRFEEKWTACQRSRVASIESGAKPCVEKRRLDSSSRTAHRSAGECGGEVLSG